MKKSSGPIKKVGRRGNEWKEFRDAKFDRDKDEEGLIRCQGVRIGLPDCRTARDSAGMDLHHIEGRDGKLLTDESKMVWLIRECHEKAHETKNPNTRRAGEAQRTR